jgi:four helix bundle protein
MRAAMSVAANYRAAGLARSRAEFISKLSIVLEEADEVVFWLELLRETDPTTERWRTLIDEARQLVKIFAASKRTITRHTALQRSRHSAPAKSKPA